MDEIDAEIIKILCKDARTSFRKIGRMLNVSTDTVFRRYKKLKQEGKILGSTVVLSSIAIGIKGWCGLYVKTKRGSSALAVREKLSRVQQIYTFNQIIGDYDFYLEIGFRDFVELDHFVQKLREIKEILTIDLVLQATHDWPLPTLHTLNSEILDLFLGPSKPKPAVIK
jgi:DNA-binding Lrp family transcriptional regulator